MFYKNIRLQRIRRRRENKNKINIWLIAITLTLAIFLNAQNIKEVKASEITSEILIQLTNQSRAEQGIEKLTVNQNLISAADSKARDMFEHNYFAHTSPQGIDPWHWIRQAGYSYQYAGENLAMDFVTSEAIHKALIASATHRKNILNTNYKEIGIAVLSGNFEDRQTTIIVQMFGTLVQTVKEQKSNIDSNLPVIKKPTVASASININKSPAAAKKINKPAIPNNDTELKSSFNNDANLNSHQNKRVSVLPIESDEIEDDKKELISEKKENNFISPFNKSKELSFSPVPLYCYYEKRMDFFPFLEINSNGRIKNASKTLRAGLFQDLSQNFDYQISRFRNKFGMTMSKFEMTNNFFFEIPEYLSCFLFGGKIDAYVK